MKIEKRIAIYNLLHKKGFIEKSENVYNAKYYIKKFIDKEKNIIIIKFNREVIK